MKVLQVCPYDLSRHGGVKTHILQLSDSLNSHGHECLIAAPSLRHDEAKLPPNVRTFGKNVGMRFGGTKIDLNICYGSEWRRLKEFIRSEKFDVIHYHTIWNPILSFQILLLSKSRNIGTFHDTPSDSFVGRFFGQFLMPLLARLVFTELDGIISVSPSQSKFISRFSNRHVEIIPNGISPPEKSPQKVAQFDDGFTNLLFLGRLEPRKGLFDAIDVYDRLKIDRKRLLIVGEGDLKEEALRRVSKRKIMNVEFLGAVDDDTKWQLYSTAHIYLATALYGESFGIVLLEAMQSKLPMVGYKNSGYANVLNDYQKSSFVLPGDKPALSISLDQMILEQPKRERSISEGIRVSKEYLWKHLTKRILEVYTP